MNPRFAASMVVATLAAIGGCGSDETAGRWSGLDPSFAANDDACPAVQLANEDDDQVLLAGAIDCLRSEIEGGRSVVADVAIPTVEGDPIYHRYAYDGEKVLVLVDSRADTYGSGSVTASECESLADVGTPPLGEDCVSVEMPGVTRDG